MARQPLQQSLMYISLLPASHHTHAWNQSLSIAVCLGDFATCCSTELLLSSLTHTSLLLLMIKVFKEKFNNHEGYLVKKPRKEGGDVSLHLGINCNAPLAPLTALGESG